MLAFAFPEYIFYWCIVISTAALCQMGWRWQRGRRRVGARIA
jgi:apolipoprotein N-acyltransferase